MFVNLLGTFNLHSYETVDDNLGPERLAGPKAPDALLVTL